jgi:hypothetical protein
MQPDVGVSEATVEIAATTASRSYGRPMGRARGGPAATKSSASPLRRGTFPPHRNPYPGERSIEEYQELWQRVYDETVAEGVLPSFARLIANQDRNLAFSKDTGRPVPGSDSYEFYF